MRKRLAAFAGTVRRFVRRLGLLAAYPVLWVCDVGINLCDYDMEPLTDVRRRSRAAWLKAWKSVTPNAPLEPQGKAGLK